MIQKRVIAFYPSLVSLTGDHTSALVLSQIIYWHLGRLRVQRYSQWWLAKSREELCRETGITLKQYKRILPLLVKQGWIVTERHLFRNRMTPHIRLTEEGWKVLQEHVVTKGTNRIGPKRDRTVDPPGPKQLDHSGSNQLVRNGANPSTEITSKTSGRDDPQRFGVEDNADGTEEDQDQEEKDPDQENIAKFVKKDAMNADDVLKAHAASETGSLGAYWQSRIKLATDYHKWQAPLTLKQRGQLALLRKRVGDEWVRPLIAYACEHWWAFATTAASSVGQGDWPTHPDIGYVLKHCELAVNLCVRQQKSDQQEAQRVLAMADEPPPSAPRVEKDPVHVATPQEVAELLDWFDSPKE